MPHDLRIDKLYTRHDLSGKSEQYEDIFSTPPAGKWILDLGCASGYYLVRAALEGADLVRGIDRDYKAIEKARNIASELQLPVAFFVYGSAESISEMITRHHITLCLNMLHHLPNIDAVRRVVLNIDRLTTERMVFITSKPKDGKPWSRKGQLKHRIALAPEYFMELMPDYHYIVRDNVPSRKRHLIDIRKTPCD